MTSYFTGKSDVSLVTVIFGNAEVDMTVGYVDCGIVFRRMKRSLYPEKDNCIS
jgi:hypothetical protein